MGKVAKKQISASLVAETTNVKCPLCNKLGKCSYLMGKRRDLQRKKAKEPSAFRKYLRTHKKVISKPIIFILSGQTQIGATQQKTARPHHFRRFSLDLYSGRFFYCENCKQVYTSKTKMLFDNSKIGPQIKFFLMRKINNI